MQTKLKEVPIPMWMKNLPRDARGYPIPFIVQKSKDGLPLFTINNDDRRQYVINNDYCGICCRKLMRFRALVGGALAAFDEVGAYLDPAMHIECAQYAMKVCPFLAAPSYTKEISGKQAKQVDGPVLVDDQAKSGRPDGDLFCLVVCTKYETVQHDLAPTYTQYVRAIKPYVRVEYWRRGVQLSNEEGLPLIKEALTKQYLKDFEDAIHRSDELIVKALARSQPKDPSRFLGQLPSR